MLGKTRVILTVVSVLLFILVFSVPTQATPKVILDGKLLYFDASPVTENGRTLVPLRTIFEALGANVSWDSTSQIVTATKFGLELKLAIGGSAYRNGQSIAIDVPAKIINGRTMVPLRFVSEIFGKQVAWNQYESTIIISDYRYDDGVIPYVGKKVWIDQNSSFWILNRGISHLEPVVITDIAWWPSTNDGTDFYYMDNSTFALTLRKDDGTYITIGDHIQRLTSLNHLSFYFFLDDPYKNNWSQKVWSAIKEKKVFVGMTTEQSRMAWGYPKDINRTTTSYNSHEQWVYGLSSYLYFDNGILTAIQN